MGGWVGGRRLVFPYLPQARSKAWLDHFKVTLASGGMKEEDDPPTPSFFPASTTKVGRGRGGGGGGGGRMWNQLNTDHAPMLVVFSTTANVPLSHRIARTPLWSPHATATTASSASSSSSSSSGVEREEEEEEKEGGGRRGLVALGVGGCCGFLRPPLLMRWSSRREAASRRRASLPTPMQRRSLWVDGWVGGVFKQAAVVMWKAMEGMGWECIHHAPINKRRRTWPRKWHCTHGNRRRLVLVLVVLVVAGMDGCSALSS